MSDWYDDNDDKGKRRDVPLSCAWRTATPDAFDTLKLPEARSPAIRVARIQILTEACIVSRADPDAWLSYSRSKNFYAARRGRYWPSTYTFSSVVPAVDQLVKLGLLEHEKASPGTFRDPGSAYKPQSRFKASDDLLACFDETPRPVVFDPRERIVLRDRDKNIIDYDDTTRTSRQRRNLIEINEAITGTAISIRGQQVNEGDALDVDNTKTGAARNTLHRVFNRNSFSLGGRFYGGWWQNIPSGYRAYIEIDGAQTRELDYPHLHPTLLHAEAGKTLESDPYDIAGWPRDLAKVAFNALINADTTQSAVLSIAQEIGGIGSRAKAEHLVAEISAKHHAIAEMFGTGPGLRLQRTDSDMAERVLLQLLKRGIVALPVHDSFIVPDAGNNVSRLDEIMDETLGKFVTKNPSTSVSYMKSVLQYGETAPDSGPPSGDQGPLVGVVLVVFPELPQGDFFGRHELSVSRAEITKFKSGIAPIEVRTAIRHEMKRRNLRHKDVAAKLGVSRPQFENVLQGRFGASPNTALAIKRFLLGEI